MAKVISLTYILAKITCNLQTCRKPEDTCYGGSCLYMRLSMTYFYKKHLSCGVVTTTEVAHLKFPLSINGKPTN